MPGDKAREQVSGTVDNARDLAAGTRVDDVLPSGIRGLISELLYLIPHALGRGTPRQQLTSSVILGIMALLASPITLTTSLYLLIPLSITAGAGLLRLIPAANSSWKESRVRKAVKKNRDVPGWRRD